MNSVLLNKATVQLHHHLGRALRFGTCGPQIFVKYNGSPRIATLGPWPTAVVRAADGQITVREFIDTHTRELKEPERLRAEAEICTLLADLVQQGIIRLSEAPNTLPYYLAIPIHEQDPNRARKEMEADGYIKPA